VSLMKLGTGPIEFALIWSNVILAGVPG